MGLADIDDFPVVVVGIGAPDGFEPGPVRGSRSVAVGILKMARESWVARIEMVEVEGRRRGRTKNDLFDLRGSGGGRIVLRR